MLKFEVKHKCPSCGSSDILEGNIPLRCLSCDWFYLQDNPCRICGGKSVSVAMGKSKILYGCKNHPITDEELSAIFSEFWKSNKGFE